MSDAVNPVVFVTGIHVVTVLIRWQSAAVKWVKGIVVLYARLQNACIRIVSRTAEIHVYVY